VVPQGGKIGGSVEHGSHLELGIFPSSHKMIEKIMEKYFSQKKT
jgi:hypothetical protein